jgi:hypothetical protein
MDKIRIGFATISGFIASLAGLVASSISQVADANPFGLTPAQLAGLSTVVGIVVLIGRYAQAAAAVFSAMQVKQVDGSGEQPREPHA